VANLAIPRVGNLPADVTSFIGRRVELAETKQLLAESRLVTLTGVGGVGKTRIALRVAAGLHRAFADQVWLVDLTNLADPGLLAQTVSETLQIHESSRRDPLLILTDHLRDRQLLLVLDNCEHLLQECAVLAETLLEEAPRVRILATSRQALNVPSEQTMPVPPLPLPDEAGEVADDLALRFEAVALFVDRAKAVQPGFRLTAGNRPAVVGICRRLDGIPLAIELAAARLRTLSPEQILERLDDRYRLLTTGSRSAPARHRTLQALIDWSYERLSTASQLLWTRSSVFAGSFDLRAAEAVCAGGDIRPDDVMDLVADLIDKSILIREGTGPVARYRQLETIREYGRQRLAALGEEDTVGRLHREYYQSVAAQTAVEQFGPNQVEWFDQVRYDYPDLRRAMDSCLSEPGQAQAGLQMSADLLFHWVRSYYLNEGRGWLDRMLASDPAPTAARAKALWAASWLAIIQGDITSAKAMLNEAHLLGEKLESQEVLGYVALFSGFAAMYTGDASHAVALYEEALTRHRAAGNPHGLALTLIRACLAYSYLGDSERAIALGEDCLAVSDAAGDIWCKAFALMAIGVEVWRKGDAARATELEQESLRLSQLMDGRLGMALNLEVLAWTAASTGQYQRAARLLGILSTQWRSIGARLSGYGHLAGYHDECVERTQKALGDEAYERMVAQGARLPFKQAVAYGGQEKEQVRPARCPDRGPQLTRREWEIARLVAQGHSNREIAGALVIAQRTAESHVENILVKLGFTSRAQIAAWVAAHDRV
jgi:predicted ATPase/DNA-binding CsgD family transcriptional regulator